MIKLYNSNYSCSFALHILIEMLNIEYEKIDVQIGSDDYKKINPTGSVPCVIDDEYPDVTMTQVVSIMKYLIKKYPNNLGGNGDIISEYKLDQMLGFINSDYHKSFGGFFVPFKFIDSQDENILNNVKAKSIENIKRNLDYLENKLDGNTYLVENKLTIADIYAFVVTRWARFAVGEDFGKYKNLVKFMEMMENLEVIKKIEESYQK